MITVRAGSAAIGLCLVLLASGCSREQQDWRSAEAADTIDSYGRFIQRHPESELVTQARTRVAQLGEERDWQRAGSADTVAAYREFIAQHPNGKWAQEANIRIQNFSLGEQTGTDAASKAAGGGTSVPNQSKGVPASAAARTDLAQPGEAAVSAGASGPRQSGDEASSPEIARAGAARPGEAAIAAGAGRSGPAAGTASPPIKLASAANPHPAAEAKPVPAIPAPSAAAKGGFGNRSAAEGIPGSASGATWGNRSVAEGIPGSASGATWGNRSAAEGIPGSASGATWGNRSAAEGIPGSASGATWGIQLGAFSSEGSATAQWRTLTTKYAPQLQGLQQHVVPADTGSGRVYRLQATVGDEGRARSICDQLRQHGQACVAVLPH